jgi:hypothetical protein
MDDCIDLDITTSIGDLLLAATAKKSESFTQSTMPATKKSVIFDMSPPKEQQQHKPKQLDTENVVANGTAPKMTSISSVRSRLQDLKRKSLAPAAFAAMKADRVDDRPVAVAASTVKSSVEVNATVAETVVGSQTTVTRVSQSADVTTRNTSVEADEDTTEIIVAMPKHQLRRPTTTKKQEQLVARRLPAAVASPTNASKVATPLAPTSAAAAVTSPAPVTPQKAGVSRRASLAVTPLARANSPATAPAARSTPLTMSTLQQRIAALEVCMRSVSLNAFVTCMQNDNKSLRAVAEQRDAAFQVSLCDLR